MTDGPLHAYRAHCRADHLTPDPAQERAAERLQDLHRALRHYRPAGAGGWLARLGFGRGAAVPRGLYIHGAVGRGKSMLMDMFFENAGLAQKRRVHFHEFMLDVHAALHEIRKAGGERDPLGIVAADIAAQTWLLCFDEFQVENIADAMILGRLLRGLFDAGVVVVATSNTEPTELYKDKLQRDRFLPSIDLLCEKLDVLELEGALDYRRESLRAMSLYHAPLGPDAASALDDAFARLTATVPATSEILVVQGRAVEVPVCALGVARFPFADLCDKPLGPADYLAIAKRFHTVMVDGIPHLPPAKRNAAKRFLTLIDALYEHNVNLVCSADVAPDALFPDGDGVEAFQRAVSRLLEMQSEEYLALPHLVDIEGEPEYRTADEDDYAAGSIPAKRA